MVGMASGYKIGNAKKCNQRQKHCHGEQPAKLEISWRRKKPAGKESRERIGKATEKRRNKEGCKPGLHVWINVEHNVLPANLETFATGQVSWLLVFLLW